MAIQAIARSLPVDHSQISEGQNNLIDERIAGVKLSAKALWQHGFNLAKNPAYKGVFAEKVSRVIPFSDGIAKVYDATKGKIVGVDRTQEGDFLTLNRVPVAAFGGPIIWGHDAYTNYVVVQDMGLRGVKIFEQELPRGQESPLLNQFQIDLDEIVYTNPAQRVYAVKPSDELQAAWNAEHNKQAK